jgi:hypothetical protein
MKMKQFEEVKKYLLAKGFDINNMKLCDMVSIYTHLKRKERE